MSKRSCPFIDDIITQSKVHVGIKQFNKNEGRLQKIYDKTLGLLFKGSKKGNDISNKIQATSGSCNKKDNMKQLCIGTNGILELRGKCESRLPCTESTKYCDCGQTQMCSNDMTNGYCAYCEISLCANCNHICSNCQQNYCLKCLIPGSEGPEICVSCYG